MPDHLYTHFTEAAVQAARLAGEYILAQSKRLNQLAVTEKSVSDYVSEVDKQAEQIIRDHLRRSFAEHAFVGEEGGFVEPIGQSDYQWVVDPLDGTTNFLRGIAHYAISIALIYIGEVVVGVVYDPAKGELFSASRGAGACLNGNPTYVSDRVSLRGGLAATGVPFNGQTLAKLDCFQSCLAEILSQETAGIRRLGAAALDLAYVAAGRYEAYWEANLNSWDIAAGVLLVQEAGGVVSDLTGGANFLETGHIIAASPGAYKPMLAACQSAYREW